MRHVIFSGNLGADAEAATFQRQDGTTFDAVKFRIATREGRSKDAETLWVSCIWSGKHDGILPFLKKGAGVIVTGSHTVATFTGKDGQIRIDEQIRVQNVELMPRGEAQKTENVGGFLTGAAQLKAQQVTEESQDLPF